MRVKYAAIEPKVELTEEELRAHYDENVETYKTPEERVAQFAAISLEAPLPPVLDDIMARAHGGEDFGELAKEFSEGPQKTSGGDIGWIAETASLPEHQKRLFNMAIGQVSDPIRGPNAVHIYKVTEKRPSTLAGRQDVRVQEILLRPQLSEEEKAARVARAQAIVDAANESGDLAAAAEAAGVDIHTTNAFSRTSTSIENVDDFDIFAFRRDAIALAPDTVSGIIEGRNNLYVAKIGEVIEPEHQEFETVREQVERNAIAAYKQTPEYQAAVAQYIADIEEKAESLEQIQGLFPELEIEIKETMEPFSQTDFLFQQGARFQAAEAFAALEDKEPGEIAGPIADFSGVEYFIELSERNEPTDEMWAEQWPEERKTLRQQALMSRQFEHQTDYFQYLREQATEDFLIQEDWAAIAQVIDYGANERTEETQTPIEATQLPADNAEVAPLEFDAPTGETDALPPLELTLPLGTVEEAAEETEPTPETETPAEETTPEPAAEEPAESPEPPTEEPTPNEN
jgi:parvulin-like peptidyl-prolyl isomerase